MISLFPCWKRAPAPCRYSWPTLVINSSWFDNMWGGLSGPSKAQQCIASHCPIGFILQLGLSKSPRDQDPTLTLFLSFFLSLSLELTRIHTRFFPPPFFGFAITHCRSIEELIYKSSLLREEIQADTELALHLYLYHNDTSPHVLLFLVKVLASVHLSCQVAEHGSKNMCVEKDVTKCVLFEGGVVVIRKNADSWPYLQCCYFFCTCFSFQEFVSWRYDSLCLQCRIVRKLLFQWFFIMVHHLTYKR